MAELLAADRAPFPLPTDGGFVGRHDEDGRLADPDIDLGVLAGGRSVSRRHVRIYRSGQTWYLQVHSNARNATRVAGKSLEPDEKTELSDGDEIMLGTVSVVFRDHGAAPDSNATLTRAGRTSAEIRAGDVSFPLLAPDGDVLTLGRHSDDGMYRPDIDLRDTSGGSTISRRHGLLFRRGNAWYLRVEAEVTNPTYVNGIQLQRGQEVPLADADQLRFGNAVATFHQTLRDYADTDKLDLIFGPPSDLTIDAGAQQATSLTLINFSGRVHWFTLEVNGVPADWWEIAAPNSKTGTDGLPLVRLDTAVPPVPTPTATSEATVTFAPPRRSDASAGIYPLLVIATSQDNRHLTRTATGQLIVKPFASMGLSCTHTEARGSSGSFRLAVQNDGNALTSVTLGVEADAKLAAKLEHAELTLANGANALVDLELRVKHRPWLGKDIIHKATVTAHADQLHPAQEVSLTVPPRIPVGLQQLFRRVGSPLKPIVITFTLLAALLAAGFYWLFPPDVMVAPAAPVIVSGATTSVSWRVQRGTGDGLFEGPSGTQQVDLPTGNVSVSPTQNVEYKLTAKNLIGLATTSIAKIQVLRIVAFSATTETLKKPGDPVTLQWTTENATSVAIEPKDDDTMSFALSGQAIFHPRSSTTYRLVATNDQFGIGAAAEVRAGFGAPKVTQFQPDRQEVYPGDPVLLSWLADGFSKLTLKGSPDDLELQGAEPDVTRRTSIQVRPVRSGQYVIVAENPDGTTAEVPVSIRVLDVQAPRLEGPAKPVSAGETTILKWQVEGANDRARLTLLPDGIDVSRRASIEVRPTHTTNYTLLLTSADGKTVSSEAVSVPVLPAIQEFRVAPAAITEGEPIVLVWTVLDAESVTITRDDGMRIVNAAPSDEARDHPPSSVTSYKIKGRNATGESVDSSASVVQIKVQPPPTPTPAPTLAPLPTPAGGVQRD